MTPKIVCIIQARRRSTRLPDKILKPLTGRAALSHVFGRCKAIPLVDEVICAGVDDSFEQPIFELAETHDVSVFRGSEQDVLSRYYFAAKQAGADWVMRVTSDCPLFDPTVANELIRLTLKSGLDFGSNADWPHGLDCELFTFALLEEAHKKATCAFEREHVTLWMKRASSLEKIHHRPPEGQQLGKLYRWVLDYPEDYDFLTAVFDRLGGDADKAGWLDVIAILRQEPGLQAINASRADDWQQENTRIHAV